MSAQTSSEPPAPAAENKLLLESIESCYACAQACLTCANACLDEPSVGDLRECIRLNLACADICITATRLACRLTTSTDKLVLRILELAAVGCRLCAEECEHHVTMHERLGTTAQSCRKCAEACTLAMQDLGGESGMIQTN